MQIKDQLHTVFEFMETPKRIVSLVPSQTELLVDLGLSNQLVGVTKFCVHPKSLRDNTILVGGTKSVHLDRIKALDPDIIICNKEENTKEIVMQCGAIAPVWVSDIYTIQDSLEMILLLGKLFNKVPKSIKICSNIKLELAAFKAFMKTKSFKKVAYLIWKEPYMAAGQHTFINELLALNKFINVIEDSSSRYPTISNEMLRTVDAILLSSEPFPFTQKHQKEIESQLGNKAILVDGEYFSWYGSRLQKAFSYFKTLH